jgi:oligosaccharyltransferase complex subunit beta
LEFTQAEGNILLALSGEASTPSAIQSLLLELDIALPADKTSVTVDHFNYDTISASDKHDVLLLQQPKPKRSNVKHFFSGNGLIAFPRAVAQTLSNSSPLLSSVLKAPRTAYSYNPKEDEETVEEPFATGEQISLVSVMQARNSARFTVVGSSEALQDDWFNAKVKTPSGESAKTANREFAKQITQWTFKETGVLKVGTIQHYQNTGEIDSKTGDLGKVGFANPTIYRIKSDVVSILGCCLGQANNADFQCRTLRVSK